MRRIIACFLLFAVCSTFLFSCGEPPLGEDELPIDEENSVKIIEYGYDLKRTKEEALIAYRIAFKVPETIDFGKSKYNFEIQLSHGGGGGWFDGGFVYPNIQRIEVVVNDHILCQDEYFDYIDSYFFADEINYSNGSNYQGKKVELYTTSEYEEIGRAHV